MQCLLPCRMLQPSLSQLWTRHLWLFLAPQALRRQLQVPLQLLQLHLLRPLLQLHLLQLLQLHLLRPLLPGHHQLSGRLQLLPLTCLWGHGKQPHRCLIRHRHQKQYKLHACKSPLYRLCYLRLQP